MQDCRKTFPTALCLGGASEAVRRLLHGRGEFCLFDVIQLFLCLIYFIKLWCMYPCGSFINSFFRVCHQSLCYEVAFEHVVVLRILGPSRMLWWHYLIFYKIVRYTKHCLPSQLDVILASNITCKLFMCPLHMLNIKHMIGIYLCSSMLDFMNIDT